MFVCWRLNDIRLIVDLNVIATVFVFSGLIADNGKFDQKLEMSTDCMVGWCDAHAYSYHICNNSQDYAITVLSCLNSN